MPDEQKPKIVPMQTNLKIKEPKNNPQNKQQMLSVESPQKTNKEKIVIQELLKSSSLLEKTNTFTPDKKNLNLTKQDVMQTVMPATMVNQPNLGTNIPKYDPNKMAAVMTNIQQNEQILKIIDAKIDSEKTNKQMQKSLIALKPAFQNIQEALQFQASLMRKDRDYDSQHYTVAQSQSLFNLTSNQITNMPPWRQ